MKLNIEGVENRIGYFDACLIKLGDQVCLNGQTSAGARIAQIVKDEIKRTQWATLPGFTDFTEHAMLNGVPLRRAGRIMTNGDREAERIGNGGLKLLFEDPTA